MIQRLKRWWLLRKARKEEEKHIPTREEIEEEHRQFMKEAKGLAKEIEEDNKRASKKLKKKTRKKTKKKKSKVYKK